MKKDLEKFSVSPSNTLKETMQKIDLNGHGICLILDNNQKLLGLVTDGDIRRSIIKGVILTIPIGKIMNISPATVPENFTPQEIMEIILNRPQINSLPVIDHKQRVCGLLLKNEISTMVTHASSLFSRAQAPLKQKRILVAGGAGYIGSVLTRQLLEKGYSVTVLDKFLFGRSALALLENNSKLKIIEGDINHIEDIITAIRDVDAVVHLAEIVGDPACSVNPVTTQQTNYLSTTTIANVCKHFQINRFIYASSCSVYGGTSHTEFLNEKSPANPLSLYAHMKLESERALLTMADGTFSPIILRFATVFGESPRMRFDLVVNTLTLKAIKEGKITIFGGDQWRPLLHVSDIARAIISIIEAPLEKVKGEIFNVGGNTHNYTINHIGCNIKELFPSSELIIEEKNVDKRNYRVDFSKINSTIGFKPLVSLADGIEEIAASLQQEKYSHYNDEIYYNDRLYQKILQ